MSFDGIVTYCVKEEIKNILEDKKIEKIHQPNKDEIVLSFRGLKERLLISANTSRARVLLTEKRYENPQSPPMFCMLMRKHLQGGVITSIEQLGLDRVIILNIRAYDELGNVGNKRLIVELMGKFSNIILVDTDGIVIDAIKRIYRDMSEREVLPGYDFVEAIRQDKLNIFNFTREDFMSRLEGLDNNLKAKRILYNVFEGFGPLIASELMYRTGIDISKTLSLIDDDEREKLFHELEKLSSALTNKDFSPSIYYKDDSMLAVNSFYCLGITELEGTSSKSFPTMSECLESVYDTRDEFDSISQLSSNIRKSLSSDINKLNRKIQKQKEELIESRNRETLKVYADILSANLHLSVRNGDSIDLDNFYDEYKKITIPLDKKLNLQRNAESYYKKYSKMKNRENRLTLEIPKAERELEYLENVLQSLDNITTVAEIEDIRTELEETGFLEVKKNNKKKTPPSSPFKYVTKEGFTIYVGKNNKQNELVTMKIAGPEDIWMHIREMPGSHVIIKTEGKEVPENTLLEGAFLAKHYSKAKFLKTAPVDYTQKKFVSKMKGGKPGMVNYREFKTVMPPEDIKISDFTLE